jgi:hypothetical protein
MDKDEFEDKLNRFARSRHYLFEFKEMVATLYDMSSYINGRRIEEWYALRDRLDVAGKALSEAGVILEDHVRTLTRELKDPLRPDPSQTVS